MWRIFNLLTLYFPCRPAQSPSRSYPVPAVWSRTSSTISRRSAFYSLSPFESNSYELAAEAVQYPAERRAALVEALREQNPDQPSLEALARPGTWVVATGQQVGLFGGPAYTIYKALTAARLARRLTERGIPAVPVFWMATEDHDLEEVNHGWVFDAAHRPVRIEAAGGIAAAGGADSGRRRPVEELRRALGGLPFADEVLALAGDAYRPGRSFGEAFHVLLSRLLCSYGVLFLDPLRPAVRRLAAPLLAQALENVPELVSLVLARNRELEARGYHAQVLVEESSLAPVSPGWRAEAAVANQGRRHSGRPEGGGSLAERSAAAGGPGLHDAHGGDGHGAGRGGLHGPGRSAVPRASGEDAGGGAPRMLHAGRRAERQIDGPLRPADWPIWRGERRRCGRAIAQQLVPPSLGQTSGGGKGGDRRAPGSGCEADLVSFDPSLAEAMDRSQRKILYQLGKIERKVGREALRRDQRASEDAGHLSRLLYPHRQLQERFYSILPFLAEHGMGLIDTIYENVRLDSPDHQVLPL